MAGEIYRMPWKITVSEGRRVYREEGPVELVPGDYVVDVEIDIEALATKAVNRAVCSKVGRSTAHDRAIKARVVKRPKPKVAA